MRVDFVVSDKAGGLIPGVIASVADPVAPRGRPAALVCWIPRLRHVVGQGAG